MKGKLNWLMGWFAKKPDIIITSLIFNAINKYFEIIFEMENELAKMKEVSENDTGQVEYAIGHCKIALEKLRKLVIEKGLPDRELEIMWIIRSPLCLPTLSI